MDVLRAIRRLAGLDRDEQGTPQPGRVMSEEEAELEIRRKEKAAP